MWVESNYIVIQESAAFLSSNRRGKKNARVRRIVSTLANRDSRFLELYALIFVEHEISPLPLASLSWRRSRSRLFHYRTQTGNGIDQLGSP